MSYSRKSIEVSLPLEVMNRESAREKSLRHGHLSTLHLWGARRPLAAARTVPFAQLVYDPSSHPDEFPTEDDQKRERAGLHGIIEPLVLSENARDEKFLAEAYEEILNFTDISWIQTGSALATGYDAAFGEFAGLAIPNEDVLGKVVNYTFLVAPHAAQAQRKREEAASEAAKAKKSVESDADADGDDEPTKGPKKAITTPELQSVKNGRNRARFEVDNAKPDATGESVKQATDKVLRHIAAADGAEDVEIVLDVRAKNSSGFGENVARRAKENSRVLGFDVSEFEDVEW